jgi:multimeric flavodoxin WrbA
VTRVAVVYHSARGHTQVLAEAVERGARSVAGVRVATVSVGDPDALDWDLLARSDAIVFGCPTFMGGPSAQMKAFMDASSRRAWATRAWKDKLAAGFTSSSAASGDKLATLMQLAIFAAQHDMVWVSLGLLPGNNTTRGSDDDLNRLGSHLGAMAHCHADTSADVTPCESDKRTAEHLGERVARAAVRWTTGAEVREARGTRHPTTKHWSFPPGDRPALPAPHQRVSLRELAARPGRFEHHLMVVARVGDAQIEIATASEPLYFAHHNVSDEYAIAMSTGDQLLEGVPFLTLFTDPDTGEDVGRVRHRIGDLVLHPLGTLHWPGRLRPPFEPYHFGPGERRTGYSVVFCASKPTPVSPDRPSFVSDGHDVDVKRYRDDRELPFLLADTRVEDPCLLAAVGDARVELVVRPAVTAPERGGFLVVLESEICALFPGDLVHIPEGGALETTGILRALLFTSASGVEPPPPSWDRVPDAPFAPSEDGAPVALPVDVGAMRFAEASARDVRVTLDAQTRDVPRYWLARMLFRIALHGYAMGYLETYGGLFWDDRGGIRRLGLRGIGAIALDDRDLPAVIEHLYRAVAPEGYVERLE